MQELLIEDIHFGKIPGTERPTLLKAGAERLLQMFRLRPSYEITRRDLENDHREYEITTTLIHRPTGQIVGAGVGSASTKESRYAYRRGEPESTGKPVPQEYWKIRKSHPKKGQDLLGGKEMIARKIEGQWLICKKSEERVPNPNIADTYNTVKKVAKKRSLVDACLTATACSDVFQNSEEEDEGMDDESSPPPRQPEKPPGSFRQALGAALMQYCNDDRSGAAEILKDLSGRTSIRELTEQQAKDALADFEQKYSGVDAFVENS